MGELRYIDVLRQTRDHGLPLDDSMDLRQESIEVWAIASLETAIGDDLMCIISSAAICPDTLHVLIHFRRDSKKKTAKYFCFLFDELERNGFDTELVTYDDDGAYTLCVPLFIFQDDAELHFSKRPSQVSAR